jgi:hypothetical protein
MSVVIYRRVQGTFLQWGLALYLVPYVYVLECMGYEVLLSSLIPCCDVVNSFGEIIM